jgi:quercetin dioxygenase-like cupin family protein
MFRSVSLIAFLAIAAPTFQAFAGQAAPSESKGISAEVVQTLPLGGQIEVMKGYQVRVRKILLEPGAAVAEHTHSDRPGLVYVLAGSVVEHRGESAQTYGPGGSWVEDGDTVHWAENVEATPAWILAIDVIPEQQ